MMRIVNLHYEGTVESDVCRAIGSRIDEFETVVGPLQLILSQLPSTIRTTVLEGGREEGPAGSR